MNIRLGIIVSCLLVSVGCGMNPTETATKAVNIDTNSIDSLRWRMRRYLAHRIMEEIKIYCAQQIALCPTASAAAQYLWREAQARMAVPRDKQHPIKLRAEEVYQNHEFETTYGICSMHPILDQHIDKIPQIYGYVRCSLLHEAAHVATSNVDQTQKTVIDYVCGSLDDNELIIIYQKAAHTGFRTTLDLYAPLFLQRVDAQLLQKQESRRVEHETDCMMLARTDCEQCLRDYMYSVRSVNQQRIDEGYLGMHELEKRLHELAGKRCTWHAAAATGH